MDWGYTHKDGAQASICNAHEGAMEGTPPWFDVVSADTCVTCRPHRPPPWERDPRERSELVLRCVRHSLGRGDGPLSFGVLCSCCFLVCCLVAGHFMLVLFMSSRMNDMPLDCNCCT
jgi:hypothetical protein